MLGGVTHVWTTAPSSVAIVVVPCELISWCTVAPTGTGAPQCLQGVVRGSVMPRTLPQRPGLIECEDDARVRDRLGVPAWLALAGGFVALLSYRTTRRDLRRAPAASVYVVVTHFRASAPAKPDDQTTYKVVNGGALPIYDVGVSVWEFGRRRRSWRFRKVGQWMTGTRLEGRVHIAIEPGGEVTGEDMSAPSLVGWKVIEAPPVLLIFRDGNGRRWVRWPDGRLNRAWSLH